MTRRRRLLFALALALASAACATRPVAPAPTWPLLGPSALGESQQVRQVLHAAYGATTVGLQCVVTVTPDGLEVVGVTALGQRAFTVEYDGEHVKAERAPQMPATVDPARLVNDLELVYWPLAALESALSPLGWTVSEPFAGTRRLTRDGHLIAEVHYADAHPWSGRVWLSNFAAHYSLSIESAPLAP